MATTTAASIHSAILSSTFKTSVSAASPSTSTEGTYQEIEAQRHRVNGQKSQDDNNNGGSNDWIIGVVMAVLCVDVILILSCVMGRRWWRRRKARQQQPIFGENGTQPIEGSTDDTDVAQPGHRRPEVKVDAPRPPRPANATAYVGKKGGRNVADEYMAQQRKEGWVSEGLFRARRYSGHYDEPGNGTS